MPIIAHTEGPSYEGQIPWWLRISILSERAHITEIYSVGPLAAGCAMNITVWSYAELLTISVLVDDRTVNDPHGHRRYGRGVHGASRGGGAEREPAGARIREWFP